MMPVEILIDMRTCGLTISQMMAEVERLKRTRPDLEIYMDGDAFAIVGRKRMEVSQ